MLRMPSLLEPRHRLLHLWTSLESSRRIHRWQLDVLSIPNYVMSLRKGDLMAIVMGRLKSKDNTVLPKNFEGIHDRFQKDSRFRDSRLRIDRTVEICIQMDKDAQKDFTCRMSSDEFMRYNKNWSVSLNTSGRNAPMKLRSDFSEALTKLHRLHRDSGEERLAPIPFWQYQKWHPSSCSSSTSWWQWNDSLWSS